MTKAVIDLGTNTFHLLIGKLEYNHLTILHEQREAVKIGENGMLKGIITDEALERAVYTLKKFKSTIESYKEIEETYIFATSAFRNAKNSESVSNTIFEKTGLKVKIISVDEEAQVIYEGVKLSGALQNETSLIVDIGGGSVEFIICNQSAIQWKKSFEIGGLRLMELFHKNDPITKKERFEIDAYLNTELQELTKSVKIYNPQILLGSSGAFDTYIDIHTINHKTEQSKVNYTKLPIDSFLAIYNELIDKNRADRLQVSGMISLRVDMIVVASCIIKFLIDNYKLHTIITSQYSLKEGVFAAY